MQFGFLPPLILALVLGLAGHTTVAQSDQPLLGTYDSFLSSTTQVLTPTVVISNSTTTINTTSIVTPTATLAVTATATLGPTATPTVVPPTAVPIPTAVPQSTQPTLQV